MVNLSEAFQYNTQYMARCVYSPASGAVSVALLLAAGMAAQAADPARDLPFALAHELAHVLSDSGEHSEEPRNLMRAATSPENTRLSEAQCRRLRERGAANGLLAPKP